MNTNQKKLIKATVPILKTHGTILIEYFYKRLLGHHPELKNIFNMGHQASGKQKNALTGTVLAYAENIDDPSVLINVLKSIGNKHVSLNITPDQYTIVGNHLIASIKEILKEAATSEIIDAWTLAYQELAAIMIEIESEMYQKNSLKKGAWKGWRTFIISKIVKESEEIKSFYLTPQDGNEIAAFFPGQYITVKIFIPELEHDQPRQYSLSSAFSKTHYRISVKKEKGKNTNPDGIVSLKLHTKKEGDTVELSTPAGVFHIESKTTNPLVLISGGVGITPLMSMLESNKERIQKNKTIWMHSCRNEKVHAFKKEIEELTSEAKWLKSFIFYETLSNNTNCNIIEGRIDLNKYKDEILLADAKYYICGPEMFIKTQYQSLITLGVTQENIFYEEFGPQLINMN